jgi:uncharacterized membrane protein SpoIIM required for sporulation
MLELLINPKKAERRPWEMFFIGFLYASVSILLATFVFGSDPVLSKYLGVFMITFCVIFTMPFMYYTLKLEERKDMADVEEQTLLLEHKKAIFCFLWLFMGFIVAFSIWFIVVPHGESLFRAQIETFCQINRPNSMNECLTQYGLGKDSAITGGATSNQRVLSIFSNNIYVLIFTLVFSLIFGAGAIFVLAWNATVIAAAIGIFVKSNLASLPTGILRYMIHGLPEIAAYFVAALAGGILSVAIIRRDTQSNRFWSVMEDVLTLIIIAIVILFISALIEVFITPKLF